MQRTVGGYWTDGGKNSNRSIVGEPNEGAAFIAGGTGKYPEWNKMSDERLMKALHTLRDEERKLIYQHVFEERTFEEIRG